MVSQGRIFGCAFSVLQPDRMPGPNACPTQTREWQPVVWYLPRMKRWIVFFVFCSSIAFAQAPDLGVMLGNIAGSPQKRIEIARQLGASWYRPEAVLLAATEPRCDDCQTARAAGLKLVLVVRNAADAKKPSTAPADGAAFQQRLREIVNLYKPLIVVVENEPEDQKRWFAGTPEEYGMELKAACDAIHAAGAKCANGAVSSESMGGVVIDELQKRDPDEAGSFAIATELVRTKAYGSSISLLGRGKEIGGKAEQLKAIREAVSSYLAKHSQEIERARAFVMAGASAGTDYANFHWYELRPEEITTVSDVLARLNKHPQMTDEMGQREERAFETGEKIRILREAGVNPIIWNGLDGKDVVGLVAKDGKIGTNGRAFQAAAQKKP